MSVSKGSAHIELVDHGSEMHVQQSTIEPGGQIEEHAHNVTSSYVVLGGKGRLTGAQGREIATGDVVVVEAHQKHGWANSGSEPLRLVGFFQSAYPEVAGVKFEQVERGVDSHIERSTIDPGATIADHAHNVASSYVVVTGKGRLTGSRARDIAAGDVVLIEAHQQHGWQNTGTAPLQLVGVFSSPSEPAGARTQLVSQGSDTHVLMSTIEPGAKIAPHGHKVASSYVVVSGKGRFTGARARDVAPGDVVVVEAGEVHGWEGIGSEALRIVGAFASAS
jgi:quercetin dioxygenase-like cupin family protein